ncbi:protein STRICTOSIDINE SYNTHASE-LIKE 3-like [Phalaenopsis equestris]|uniref:protein STRICTOSIDINE SYNTHASE-LIKE 3-like n=1 Tax=Phalaenopsis equestris TaxID=78828 RepID=UPI0009E3B38E|nr:protein STRICTOSIDINE SYNTHASE-LIKE 3-like [Phalaenopsis equestris]
MSPATITFAALIVMAAIYCGTNPFNHGAMAGFPGFETYKVELPPATAVPADAVDSDDRLTAAEVRFMNQVQGPESIAFDPTGGGPYTGVADGRVLFWDGERWRDFAFTSPNRSTICDPKPSASSYLENEHICGRPLGLRFDKKTGDLYIADAYYGLLKVGPQGGLASLLTSEAEGIPFKFTNDLDIDEEGNVYFTVSSNTYYRRNFLQSIFTGDPTGRLLKYNHITKETIVLLHGLQFPNGVSLSKDGSFLVFCESSRNRLTRYWLKGEKAGTPELFAIVPGAPDNVRTNENGEFWVAIHCRRRTITYFFAMFPKIRKFFLKLPIPTKLQYLTHVGGKLHALIIKYGPDGNMLRVLEDRQGKVVRAVSEVEERDGKLWIGSVLMPYIAVYADEDS